MREDLQVQYGCAGGTNVSSGQCTIAGPDKSQHADHVSMSVRQCALGQVATEAEGRLLLEGSSPPTGYPTANRTYLGQAGECFLRANMRRRDLLKGIIPVSVCSITIIDLEPRPSILRMNIT